MIRALRALTPFTTPAIPPADAPFMVDDMEIAIRRHPRARRLTLRYDTKKNRFVMSAPKRASRKSMIAFANENTAWMRTQHHVAAPVVTIGIGDTLPLQGKDRIVLHRDAAGVKVELTDAHVIVHCRAARFTRALQRYLQQHAHQTISELSYQKAATLGKPIQSVTCRDTTSRWGSCTHDGKLSFSWRLIMAPQEVIDYVVAHEVAHLAVFDHSPRFWATCRTLTDHTTFGKHWLQQNGNALHRIRIQNETPSKDSVEF